MEAVYHAFANAGALQQWQAPVGMTAKVHRFDWREGGGYEMSLYYRDTASRLHGKTAATEDRYSASILELQPFRKIVLAIQFITDDPAFAGKMIVEITLDQQENGTFVTYFFKDIPPGIRPADNEEGTIATLENLERYATAHNEIDEQASDGSANAFDGK